MDFDDENVLATFGQDITQDAATTVPNAVTTQDEHKPSAALPQGEPLINSGGAFSEEDKANAKELFKRYGAFGPSPDLPCSVHSLPSGSQLDLDSSGSINSLEEAQQLTMNCLYTLRFTQPKPEEVDATLAPIKATCDAIAPALHLALPRTPSMDLNVPAP
jgi:hypothetical protein